MENFYLVISVGFSLFLAGVIMDPREEEDRRGVIGNLQGAVGVMVGVSLFFFIAQWAPIIGLLKYPVIWILVFLCFRLSNLYEMVAMCGLTYIVSIAIAALSSLE